MKAIIWTAYGSPDVLKLSEIDKPTPADHEVLVRVKAATVFAGDCEMRRFDFPISFWFPLRLMFGLRRPKRKVQIPGQELAGEVVAAGDKVTKFKKGDKVFAALEQLGACAEYKCLDERRAIAHKPENMSFEEAATVPVGGLNALHFVRKSDIRGGEKVVVYGAAGSIGTFAVQIAKDSGAEVTAVDSTGKLNMLRSIGADHVIDYTQEDFTESGEVYDVIIDIVGKSSYSRCVRSLNPGGRYILGNPRFSGLFRGWWTSTTSNKKVIAALAGYKAKDLEILKKLIEAGEIRTVIDRQYPLERIADAHRYVETGQKTGHVVINVPPASEVETPEQ